MPNDTVALRYLVGPLEPQGFVRNFQADLQSGRCYAFGTGPNVDFRIGAESSWNELRRQFPPGWLPDFVALWCPYQRIPDCFWTCGLPLVALAPDWSLLWHDYRRYAPYLDLIFTDGPGQQRMREAGWSQAESIYLFGGTNEEDPPADPATRRELDVVFAGNLNPAIQGERLSWLARLSQTAKPHRVRIASFLPPADYRRLLRRAKIVFNRSLRGEANARITETLAAGALLFQEADNHEVRHWLDPNSDFVAYTSEDLEDQLDYYLSHEDERLARCHAAQGKIDLLRWPAQWGRGLHLIAARMTDLKERARARQSSLTLEAARQISRPPHEAILRLIGERTSTPMAKAQRDAELREWFAAPPSGSFDLACRPDDFGPPRMAWEEAAWRNAGAPEQERVAKAALARAAVAWELGQASGQTAYYYEGLRSSSDFVPLQVDLSLSLAAAGEWSLAAPYLWAAGAALPFHPKLAATLHQCEQELGHGEAAASLRQRRWALAAAAPGVLPREAWFAPRISSEPKVSLIVLCCNRADLTRACLASVRDTTSTPCELILVDNGSTDETPALLVEHQNLWGADRVKTVRNDANRGFAAGCNQGLRAATGEILVLLNNDTIVTRGWLDRLLLCLRTQWPRVGAVGPMSNAVPPPQLVPVPEGILSNLEAFSERHRLAHQGQAQRVPRLSGFCLAMPRRVQQMVGDLDESFGLGYFEDDDYSFRICEAGFELAIVKDAFVYHHGSASLMDLGINQEQLLARNFAHFRDKWGPEATRGYRPCRLGQDEGAQEQAAFAEPRDPVADVSLTMIVRNEAANLTACLSPIRQLFRELIVVDTGSEDQTRAIAAALGAKVSEFPWCDSFAAARNHALQQATSSWCFWLDADDRVGEPHLRHLAQVFADLSSFPERVLGLSMKCECLASGNGATTAVDHVRLFRRHPGVLWEYRVHEQIVPSIRRVGGEVAFADHIVITHIGYQDNALRRRKLERDLRLLQLQELETPDDPFVLFNRAGVALELDEPEAALGFLQRSLDRSSPGDSIFRKLFALKAQACRSLGRLPAALSACTEGRRWHPDDMELLFHEALVRRELGDLRGAKDNLLALRRCRPGPHFASVDTSLRGIKALHNLAIVCTELGETREAREYWHAALRLDSNYGPARQALAETLSSAAAPDRQGSKGE